MCLQDYRMGENTTAVIGGPFTADNTVQPIVRASQRRRAISFCVKWQNLDTGGEFVAIGLLNGADFIPVASLTPTNPYVRLTVEEHGDLVQSPLFCQGALTNDRAVGIVEYQWRGKPGEPA